MNKQMLTQPKALHRAQNIFKGTREKSECDVIGNKVFFPNAAGTSKPLGFLDARNSQTIVDITIREKVHPTDIEN